MTEPPYPSTRYAWYVVVILMVIYIFAFIDRQILSMMIGDLKEGLNLEKDWHAGFLMGPPLPSSIPCSESLEAAWRTPVTGV